MVSQDSAATAAARMPATRSVSRTERCIGPGCPADLPQKTTVTRIPTAIATISGETILTSTEARSRPASDRRDRLATSRLSLGEGSSPRLAGRLPLIGREARLWGGAPPEGRLSAAVAPGQGALSASAPPRPESVISGVDPHAPNSRRKLPRL